jgi:hypothetical protein
VTVFSLPGFNSIICTYVDCLFLSISISICSWWPCIRSVECKINWIELHLIRSHRQYTGLPTIRHQESQRDMQTPSKHKTGRWIETTYSLDPPLLPPPTQTPLTQSSKQSINAHHPHRLLSLGKTIFVPFYHQWLSENPVTTYFYILLLL